MISRPPEGSQDLMNSPARWFSWYGDGQHDFICRWEALGAFSGTCFCSLVQEGEDRHSIWQTAKAFHMGWWAQHRVSVVILDLLPYLSRAYLCRWEQRELSSASWSPSWPDASWSWSRCHVGTAAECSARTNTPWPMAQGRAKRECTYLCPQTYLCPFWIVMTYLTVVSWSFIP